ncbi:MAG: alpha-N-arabinofuranosidase [Bifidobacteriaceae bacterium]|jgi:alpha-N-arabinofuranosidase|nr:alpha-N-arabinofuranosidase [Bifidobacteriaceae bacterium]
MTQSTVTQAAAHTALTRGAVDPLLFGSFVEHMGRVVYSGIYEPGHPRADEAGRRLDVIEQIKAMGVTCIRYPGGNFVSGHDWRDMIGPVAERPRRLDLAWRAIETHQFGLAEFLDWAALAGVEPMLTVNLGTAGIREAIAMVEYCNFPGGTRESDLRRAHGRAEPWGVKRWCLGNEMDGPWQIGQKTAQEYGRLAAEVAKAMRLVDEDIKLAACGSSSSDMPTYPAWELEVLRHTYPYVDYLAVHRYYGGDTEDAGLFLAKALDFDRYLTTLEAVCDVVKAEKRSSKPMAISVDEWGVWDFSDDTATENAPPWLVAPAFAEQVYTLQDTLLFGSLLLTMLRHADRVKMACQSLLTNISACIMAKPGGEVWLQPIFYPFAQVAAFAGAQVLQTGTQGPVYDAGDETAVPVIDFVALHDAARQRLGVFAINRDATSEQTLELDLAGCGDVTVAEHTVLTHPDRFATNRDNHQAVVPQPGDGGAIGRGRLTVKLPPLSWTAVTLSTQG